MGETGKMDRGKLLSSNTEHGFTYSMFCPCCLSCLIARNLLSGLKTCVDVSSYMRENEVSVFRRSSTPNLLLDDGRTDPGNDVSS